MKKILIVEDDKLINQMLKELLTQNQYQVCSAFSGTEALLRLEKEGYDLILLDYMLPGMDGKEVLKEIRKKNTIPIILLTAKDEIETKIDLLKSGADDYITKPFNNEELLARMEVVIRRNIPQKEQEILTLKELTLNPENYEVTLKGKKVNLTKREYLVLKLLMSYPNKVFTKDNIFKSVWEEEYLGEDNTVNVHISNIRQKLAQIDDKEEYIKTIWGIGFKMNTETLSFL